MSWSYSHNPANSPKDHVRFLLGDTDSKQPLLQDEEIQYVLLEFPNAKNAALSCCDFIVAKFSRMADQTVGSVSKSYSQMSSQYRKFKEDLRTRIGVEDCTPYAGGISRSDKHTIRQNTDRVKPDFEKHQFENDQIAPWTSQTELDEFLELEI
jgi:hypothetical protein